MKLSATLPVDDNRNNPIDSVRQVDLSDISELSFNDLEHLCEATEEAIKDGIGFNWITPPMRETLESYWNGVAIMPHRLLIGAWLDGVLCGAIQLVKPTATRETSSFAATIEAHFVAPWARGHGIAVALLRHAEREAAKLGYTVLRLSVRETQKRALAIYRNHGYIEWGRLPFYEVVNGDMLAGHHFYKTLQPLSSLD